MVALDLTPHEAEVLLETLRSYLAELRMEISHTDREDFRSGLKERRQALEHIVEMIERATAR